jgi:hypothetical protein
MLAADGSAQSSGRIRPRARRAPATCCGSWNERSAAREHVYPPCNLAQAGAPRSWSEFLNRTLAPICDRFLREERPVMFSSLRHVLFSLLIVLAVLAVNVLFFGSRFSNIEILAIYAVVTLAQTGFDFAQRRSGRIRGDWHHLTPSPMEWFALIGCVALGVLCLCIFFFVGSGRPDAASQMTVLKWLIVAFTLGSAVVFYGSFASDVRWNDEQIEQHRLFGPKVIIRWADLAGVETAWDQSIRLFSRHGGVISFSPYQNGAAALAARIMGREEQDSAGTE